MPSRDKGQGSALPMRSSENDVSCDAPLEELRWIADTRVSSNERRSSVAFFSYRPLEKVRTAHSDRCPRSKRPPCTHRTDDEKVLLTYERRIQRFALEDTQLGELDGEV